MEVKVRILWRCLRRLLEVAEEQGVSAVLPSDAGVGDWVDVVLIGNRAQRVVDILRDAVGDAIITLGGETQIVAETNEVSGVVEASEASNDAVVDDDGGEAAGEGVELSAEQRTRSHRRRRQ